jgi:hypothetical protein
MTKKSLEQGLRVKLWKLGNAGGYEIQKIQCFYARMTLAISNGEPFEHARMESEELSVVLDAEYEIEGEIVRESLTGKYFVREESK